jgi:hypothetical protein
MHREQTRVLAISIAHGIRGYHAEYQKFPVPEGVDAESKPIRSDPALAATLLGLGLEMNPKRIRFLPDLRDASGGGYGMKLVSDREAIIVDPWGEEFYIILDRDGDGSVPNPNPAAETKTLLQPVLVYSAGPDKDPNTWADNVASWIARGLPGENP